MLSGSERSRASVSRRRSRARARGAPRPAPLSRPMAKWPATTSTAGVPRAPRGQATASEPEPVTTRHASCRRAPRSSACPSWPGVPAGAVRPTYDPVELDRLGPGGGRAGPGHHQRPLVALSPPVLFTAPSRSSGRPLRSCGCGSPGMARGPGALAYRSARGSAGRSRAGSPSRCCSSLCRTGCATRPTATPRGSVVALALGAVEAHSRAGVGRRWRSATGPRSHGPRRGPSWASTGSSCGCASRGYGRRPVPAVLPSVLWLGL